MGVISGDTSNVTLSNSGATGTFASANAGTGIGVTASGFTISGSAAGNYSLSQPTGLTANITPAGLSLTISGVTASDKTYDGTTSDTLNTAGDSLVGVQSQDSGNVILINSGATGTFASANVGTGITVIASGFTISGSAADNYTLQQPTGLTANISPVTLTISGVTASDKTYDGTTSDTLNTAGDSLVGVISGDTGNVTLSNSGATGTFASANVGTGIGVTASGFTISGSAAGNYSLTNPPV